MNWDKILRQKIKNVFKSFLNWVKKTKFYLFLSKHKWRLVTGFLAILILFFASETSWNLISSQGGAAAQWGVAVGTSLLALFTFLTTLESRSIFKKQKEELNIRENRELALKRLEGFYSPLVRILSSNPDTVENNRPLIENMANEIVQILKGKRYLSSLETLPTIPKDVEKVAFTNWMEGALLTNEDETQTFNPKIGFLTFESKDQMSTWSDFAHQLWIDYDRYVKEFYTDQQDQDQEPDWKFSVKEVK